MGTVYEALDRERGIHVALKVLSSSAMNAERLLLFKKEFRALQDLQHPNLVQLGELFEESGQWFFTMELVEGVDFLTYVRPPVGGSVDAEPPTSELTPSALDASTFETQSAATPLATGVRHDEARLRAALIQLAHALSALHRSKKVHRDLKPSNMLVTPSGRLVVLDFGIISELDQPEAVEDQRAIGTVAYMAPEQATGGTIGAAADWYSFGVLLFQALTGRLPFTGLLSEILEAKSQREAPPVHTLMPWVPYNLDQLCRELLQRDPAQRPRADKVLECLQVSTGEPEIQPDTAPSDLFIGRRAELSALDQAFRDSRQSEGLTILVQGESGVGKSALVRRFLLDIGAHHRGLLVLSGRCYERESVPYKAIDSVVDRLALYLRRLPSTELSTLLPGGLPALAQLFPVLAPLCAEGAAAGGMEPMERRQLAFATLRELLDRLARRTSLILVIDDLQWADADSCMLLGELLRSPTPPFLLIGTVRSRTATLDGLDPLRNLGGQVRQLPIEKLPDSDARELAVRLLGEQAPTGDADVLAAEVVREAQGHPLFIDELVRLRRGPGETAPRRLDEALWMRVQQLPGPARNLLEVVSVAGIPLRQELAAQAAAIDLSHFDAQVAHLRQARLIRTAGARRTDTIETYHDRVRESIVSRLSPKAKRLWHGRLALALEATEPIAHEAVLDHWYGAGHPEQAARYAVQAAEQAAAALAFERAARLYEQALELSHATGDRRRELLIRLGEALINQGRGQDAANLLVEAAAGAPPMQASLLRRQAADQYLRSGRFNEGIDLVRQVLDGLGLNFPANTAVSVGSLAAHRLWLSLRGFKFQERSESEVAPEELNRIDTLRACTTGLGAIDNVRGADLTLRMVVRALRAGERARVALALTETALVSSVAGSAKGWQTGRELLETARRLAAPLANPYTLSYVVQTDGMIHHVSGRFRQAARLLEEAEGLLRERCTGVHWELDLLRTVYLSNAYFLGDIRGIRNLTPIYWADAEKRSDFFMQINLATNPVPVAHLAQDEPAAARAQIDRHVRLWTHPGPALPKVSGMLWSVASELYEGRGQASHRRLRDELTLPIRMMSREAQVVRIIIADLRARTALLAASELPAGREELLGEAAGIVRQLGPESTGWSTAACHAIRGGMASLRGDRPTALAELWQAIERFDQADMVLHAAVGRRLFGLLTGGDAGSTLVAQASHYFSEHGIVNPRRFSTLLFPGYTEPAP